MYLKKSTKINHLQSKIKHLESTLDHLETKASEYNWNNPALCNCGILARQVGVTVDDIYNSYMGYWSNSLFCTTTNLTIKNIIKKLKDNFFTLKEVRDFEKLKNNKYRSNKYRSNKYRSDDVAMVTGTLMKDKRLATIHYLQHWIEDLKSQVNLLTSEV